VVDALEFLFSCLPSVCEIGAAVREYRQGDTQAAKRLHKFCSTILSQQHRSVANRCPIPPTYPDCPDSAAIDLRTGASD
jgi:hypothetical protein